MSSLFWKICVFILVNIQVIEAESTVSPDPSTVVSSLADQTIGSQSSYLLPNTTICGNSSRLDQFPWMALIEYEISNGSREFNCGGFLINERYILTSAVCIEGAPTVNLTVIRVRLGEFNLATDPDCIKTVNGVQCAPPPLDIETEEQIVHEHYNKDDRNRQHNIALLRLKEEIKFTETVRPLCLPTTSKELSETYIGKRLTVVGWGKTETSKSSSAKRKVKVPVREIETCRSTYNRARVDLGEGQFCAGGESGRDSCSGDGGNALMAPNINAEAKGYLYAAGMVSFGPSPCGLNDWPSVYTNISTYMPWILSKLRSGAPRLYERAVSEPTVSPDDSTTDPSPAHQKIDVQSYDLLPNTTMCGRNSRLNRFPWMALIEYETRSGQRHFHCGGFLINTKYVLSSAVCLKTSTRLHYKILGIRLGEFNLDTDPDCIKTARGVECVSSPLNFEIEEQIVHEGYVSGLQNQQHNIGLFRLKGTVEFTETIRPLCLPTAPEERSRTYIGKRLTLAGWGQTEFGKYSSIKLSIRVPVQDLEKCKSKYKQYELDLGDGHFCAGGEVGRDACHGDDGNALMAADLNQNIQVYWYAAGIVSFGIKDCGQENWPSVYTNISTYMPWILDKLRP